MDPDGFMAEYFERPRRPLEWILASPNETGVKQFLDAIQDGKLEEAKLIFDAKNIEPDVLSSKGETALHMAARGGFVDCVKFLLEKGADVNKTERRRKCPLHLAASAGKLDVAKVLIQAKASLDIIDKYGRTPLMWATFFGNEDMVKGFLAAGVSVRAHGNWHSLHEACKGGFVNIAQLLINAGAPINNPHEFQGKCAPWSPLHIAVRQGHLDCINLLIDAGADVHSKNAGGHSPLHEAAYRGFTDIVMRLLRHNAKPNGINGQKRTPLHDACQQGNVLCATILLDAGSNPNAQDMIYETPLHLALRTRHPPPTAVALMMVLLHYGASTTLLGKEDEMPLDIIRDTGQHDCLNVLLDAAEKPQHLLQICKVCIRRQLKYVYNSDKVDKLPIPVSVKGFLREEVEVGD